MASIQHLFEYVCHLKPITVVFGNLGRWPSLLSYYLDKCFEGTVKVTSDLWDDMNESLRDDGSPCDVLVWMEPNFGETVALPKHAGRLIVLTSHLSLILPDCQVVGHHEGVQPPLVPSMGYMDHSPLPKLYPEVFVKSFSKELPREIAIDLTSQSCSRDAFLCLLNGRDYIALQRVTAWAVVVSKSVERSMEFNMKQTRRRIEEYKGISTGIDDVLKNMYLF